MADEQSKDKSAKGKAEDFYAQLKKKTVEAGKVAKKKADGAIAASRDAMQAALGAAKEAGETMKKK